MGHKYDFSGMVTVNDLLCSDGRTIRKDAFAHCDGRTVPLVWNHQHNGPENVLGNIYLKNTDNGVRGFGAFNDTERGRTAKQLIQHGDIQALSIYANQLKESNRRDVLHGEIREVSLVLAGANPEAFIDTLIAHAEGVDESAIIYNGVDDTVTYYENGYELSHADDKKEESDMADNKPEGAAKNPFDVFDKLSDEQKEAVYAIIGFAMEDKGSGENGGESMKQNAFDDAETYTGNVLSHSDMKTIIDDGKRFGSLKDSFLAHADDYGIKDIEWLFPEYKNINGDGAPGFIKHNPDGWVQTVMNGVHHTPYSRIKMMFADIREDDARARGYLKGHYKKEEVFSLLKRVVDPTTVYKKQKFDRDDVIDIKDFDVISWVKAEMRMMLDEELARAYVFGDGRSAMSEDKIDERHIIPICKEEDLYNIKYDVVVGEGEDFTDAFVDGCVIAQDDYEGSGNIKAFIGNKVVTKMLLKKNLKTGERMYKNIGELATAMSVDQIVKVPMHIVPQGVLAVLVDLSDYNVGADKGGSVSLFDDFDINYNQMIYLIETRCSGALTKPFSAITMRGQLPA